ncbi:hypothetical protein ACSBR1_009363 [Camellia fascicularis]
MDDRSDLLPLYCPHKLKTFLFAGWAYGIKHVGQSFWGGAYEFRSILCKYAIECRFQFKYIKNDSVRVMAVCWFATSTGCLWSVHGKVATLNGVHSCSAAVRTFRNLCTGSELVSIVITDHVREQPLTRPTDVVFDMKNAYGLDVSYRVTWLGVEKARGEVYGDHAMSFNQLRWYSNAVMENNPHSYINLDFDQKTSRFVRYFISFHACIDGLNYCHPLLFLNGTFLKGRFKGNLLATTAKDGNQGLFPVAFAIVDFENALDALCIPVGTPWILLVTFPNELERPDEICECRAKNWVDAQVTGMCLRAYWELFPKMEKSLDSAFKTSRSWIVSQADENVFEVQSNPSVLIDVGTRTCSCFQWQLNGFPCPDVVVVFHNSGKDIYEYVNPFYHVKEFMATYYGAIHPVPTIGKPKFTLVDYLIAPPIVKRSPGRPTWKRILSKGEVVSRIRCGRCGKIGNHNRKACKEPM